MCVNVVKATLTVLALQSFHVWRPQTKILAMFSGECIIVRPKSYSVAGCGLRFRAGVRVGQILPTPAPTPTPAKTVDSDRLQLRSRLRLSSPDVKILRSG